MPAHPLSGIIRRQQQRQVASPVVHFPLTPRFSIRGLPINTASFALPTRPPGSSIFRQPLGRSILAAPTCIFLKTGSKSTALQSMPIRQVSATCSWRSRPETSLILQLASAETASNDSTAINASLSSTPLPAALPLFATGLGVMGWLARRKKRNAAFLATA